MPGELIPEHVEQHKLLGWHELGLCQVGCERHQAPNLAQERARVHGRIKRRRARGGRACSEREVARDERVRHGLVQLGVVTRGVNRYVALERLVRLSRVAHNVVGEVVLSTLNH